MGGPGPPPLFLDQPEVRKNFFLNPPPSPPSYLRVWMTGPSLIRRSGSTTADCVKNGENNSFLAGVPYFFLLECLARFRVRSQIPPIPSRFNA